MWSGGRPEAGKSGRTVVRGPEARRGSCFSSLAAGPGSLTSLVGLGLCCVRRFTSMASSSAPWTDGPSVKCDPGAHGLRHCLISTTRGGKVLPVEGSEPPRAEALGSASAGSGLGWVYLVGFAEPGSAPACALPLGTLSRTLDLSSQAPQVPGSWAPRGLQESTGR